MVEPNINRKLTANLAKVKSKFSPILGPGTRGVGVLIYTGFVGM